MSVIEKIMDMPMQYTSEVFGQFDYNIKRLKRPCTLPLLREIRN